MALKVMTPLTQSTDCTVHVIPPTSSCRMVCPRSAPSARGLKRTKEPSSIEQRNDSSSGVSPKGPTSKSAISSRAAFDLTFRTGMVLPLWTRAAGGWMWLVIHSAILT
jgi:hypothetical protein